MKEVTKRYKYRVYPTPEQKDLIVRTMGCARLVYNRVLFSVKEQHHEFIKDPVNHEKPIVNRTELSANLTQLKTLPEYSFLRQVSAVALQQSVNDLVQAYSNFFNSHKKKTIPKAREPTYKRKKNGGSFRVTGENSVRFKNGELKLPCDDTPLKVILNRPLPSPPSSYTIIQDAVGDFYVSFVCTSTVHRPNGLAVTGVDMGISSLAIFSDGTKIDNPKHFQKLHARLKRAQQTVTRRRSKLKDKVTKRTIKTKNYKKASKQVATIHRKIANRRLDHLHKLTTRLVRDNQVVGIENLGIFGLLSKEHSKSTQLHARIQDASWGLFRRLLEYKVEESVSCRMVLMDRYFASTQTCSHCLEKREVKLKLHERDWICLHCGTNHDRDINAAKNIQRVARATVIYADQSGIKDRILKA